MPICSSVPLARTPTAARPVPTIDRPMPASPQNSSSIAIGMPSPVGSKNCCGVEVQRVDADLGRLLDDRPGRLLALVPLGGGRADDVGGEAVDPVADGLLIVVEFEREVAHRPLHAAHVTCGNISLLPSGKRCQLVVLRAGRAAGSVTLRRRATAGRAAAQDREACGGDQAAAGPAGGHGTAAHRTAGSRRPRRAEGRPRGVDERHRRGGGHHQADPLPALRRQERPVPRARQAAHRRAAGHPAHRAGLLRRPPRPGGGNAATPTCPRSSPARRSTAS